MKPETGNFPIAGIILAAGGSTRMGTPKQLLLYQGQTLLRRAADAALGAGLAPLIVVTGGDPTGQIRQALAGLPVRIVPNPRWQAGLGTSIRAGLQSLRTSPSGADALASRPALAGVLLSLCDQPLITAPVLRRLVDAFGTSGKGLAAASYDKTLGVPAIFAPHYFPALLSLSDHSGAKPILLQHQADLQSVPMPEAATDIDDPAAYAALIQEP